MWSDTLRSVILAELTVPWEANIEWAHERKASKYHDLKNQIEDNDWKCHVYPVEVGCHGFVGQSTVKFLHAIGVAPRIRQATIRKLHEMVETAYCWDRYWNRPRKEVWVPAEDGGWWAGSLLYVGYGCVRLFCNLGNIDSETAQL